MKGLANPVLERLLPLDLPTDLDALIALATRTDNRLAEFQALRGERSATSPYARPHAAAAAWIPPVRSEPEQARAVLFHDTEEPMQMGRARLSADERQRRMREGRCYYCGEPGHRVASCPAKSPRPSRPTTAPSSTTRILTPVQVKHHTISMDALIDSGADESLMDWGLAKRLALETRTLGTLVKSSSLNSHKLFTITHATEPVELIMGKHTEQLSFYLYRSNTRTLVLGYPWLVKHNPRMDWPMGRVEEWGRECEGRCLQKKATTSTISVFNVVSAHPTADS